MPQIYKSGSALYLSLATSLVALYPASWRERYSEEMVMLLEDAPPTLKTLLNLSINLFDAHLHHNLVQERKPVMLQKMRSYELTIYGAALVFFVALFVAQRYLTNSSQVKSLLGSLSVTAASPLLSIVHSAVLVLPLLALLGGLPIVLVACWKALKARKVGTLLLCLLGLVSLPTAVVLGLVSFSFLEGTALRGFVATSLSLCIFFAGLGASLLLVSAGVHLVAPDRRVTHTVFPLTVLIPVVMIVGLLGLLVSVLSTPEALFATGDTGLVMRQGALILVMAGACSCAFVALKKGFEARKLETEVVSAEQSAMEARQYHS